VGLECADTASDVMTAVDTAAHVGRRRASGLHERSAHRHLAVPAIPLCSSAGKFPVALRCPKCGNDVSEGSICAATGEPCMTDHEGIPRFLFGQKYWGEIGSETMRQLLQEAAGSHWRTALLKCVPDEPVTAHLLAPIRADFLHAMPWNRIRNVLDIGAGMGFMSCDLALYADSVVSLEAVPERAEFIRTRARQDRLNVFPVIASAMELPFPPESFDLITLNGVLEYFGLWGEGDPKQLQEEFLRKSLTLLRPGGYLYVGVETRYAATALLGGRDHSGLPYTSVMPRRLADLYCRLRATPFHGSEHAVRGYRTYTHTPLQYERMVKRAGYDNVSVQGVFEGYNRQRVLYGLDDHAGRKALLERVNPAASLAGSVRRLLTDNRAVYRTLENEVVIFAQKPAPDASAAALPWAEIAAPQRTVVQVNQNFKTLAVICDQGVPVEILEVEKKGHEDAGRRLQRSFEILGALEQELKEQLPALPIRWAKPRGTVRISGRVWRRYEYIHGRSLATHLLPRHYDPRVVPQLFTRAIASYVDLCGQLTTHLRGSDGAGADDWQDVEEQLAGLQMGDDIRQDFQLAVRHAMAAGWRLSVIHGDFSAGNLLVTPSGEMVLLDWEHFSSNYPLGADLLRFLQDSIIESDRLKPRTGSAFRRHLTEAVQAALAAYGYGPQDYRHLDALYIGHQVAVLGGESCAYQPLLDAYRARRRLSGGPPHDA
jgi:SAM-dependent methyltransferase/aminoglycoside phosphotransferase (APT) family kinase protein